MSKRTQLIVLLISDAIAVLCANYVHYVARFDLRWFGDPEVYPAGLIPVAVALTSFWLFLLMFFGMYRERYAESRLDEIVQLLKVVSVGILILVFAIFIDALRPGSARSVILFYWIAVFGFLTTGRMVVRAVQKALILRGHGTHKVLVVGWSDRVEQLFDEIASYPEAGLNVVGAVRLERDPSVDGGDGSISGGIVGGDGGVMTATAPHVSSHAIESLPRLIDELGVQDVLIALGQGDQDKLVNVLRLCDGKDVTLKLVPDFYTVIGGMARTEHIYGLPLIEVLPVPMAAWEQSTKRLIDIVVSAVVLAIGFPLWLVFGIFIRANSPGSIIYRQERVGQHGETFTMYKFRTMRHNAEAVTGPVWATENDPRYTAVGRWLRKWRFDEVPQFWNVLRGDMSLVGPRPERPYFVEKLAADIPLYRRRHRVKPGITGWAQVKWKYDGSLSDVRQKVKYDLFYIENMSLQMDLKILFRTVRTAVNGSGQ